MSDSILIMFQVLSKKNAFEGVKEGVLYHSPILS